MGISIYNNVTAIPKQCGLLPRPRLNELFTKAMEQDLVTVTAGAGYGKTQAISMFLNRNEFFIAWYQLSNLDNYQTRFWNGLLEALSLHNSKLAAEFAQLGFPYSLAKFNKFLQILAKRSKNEKKYVIVFDDLHLIYDESIKEFIENLVAAKLQNLAIILISRTEINLNRTPPPESQITAEDLCFTAAETAAYLKMCGLNLSQATSDRIHHSTEGWPLAIYLVSLTLHKSGLKFIDPVTNAIPAIFQTIDNEIFSNYTPPIQQLLIKLSLLDEFQVALMQEISGTNISMMIDMIHTNRFIRYNPHTENYSFHHLFLRFLQTKQIGLTAEQRREIYFKAARWYDENGLKMAALVYYGKCGDYEKIWDIISHYEIDMPPNEASLFMDLIDSFPEKMRDKYPLIKVVYGRLLLNNGRIEESFKMLSEIKTQYEHLPATPAHKAIIGEACIFLAMISLVMKNYDFVTLFKTAARYLPCGSALVDNRLFFHNGNYAVTIAAYGAGEVKKFEEAIFAAMPQAAKAMNGCCYGTEHLTAAEAAYYRGEMKKAEKNAYQAIYLAQQQNQGDTLCSAYFVLIRHSFAGGNYHKAYDLLKELEEKIEALDANKCLNIIDTIKGWFYAKLEAMEKVPHWIMDEKQSSKMLSPNNIGRDRLIRAFCFLKNKNYYELMAFVNAMEKIYDNRGFLLPRIEIQALKAIAAHKTKDISLTREAMEKAYELSHENDLIMPFIECGSYMRTVIDVIQKDPQCFIPRQWLKMVQRKASTYAKQIDNVQVQYRRTTGETEREKILLTIREIEILQGLSQGLTRVEMAESLGISTNTVKSILQNIYNKLGALNSVDAVRIALQKGLIK